MKKLIALKSFVVSAALVCGIAANAFAEEETPPATEWEYNSTAKTISSGGWTFKVTLSQKIKNAAGENVTGAVIGQRTVIGTEPNLNFRTAAEKIGQDIISFSSTFYGSYGDPANTAIVKVWLPDTVLTIQGNTFRNCANLEQIYPLIPPNLVSIADYGYQACPKLTGTLTLGPNVSSIGGNSFSSDTGLTEIVLGDSMRTVGNSSFVSCTGVTKVTFNEGLEKIGDNAFDKMTGVEETVNFLPTTVTSVGSYAFRNWSAYEGELKLGDEENADKSLSFGTGAFIGMSKLTRVSVGAGVSSFSSQMFHGDLKISEFEFFGYVTFAANSFGGGNAANSLPDFQSRFLLPFNNTQWSDYIRDNEWIVAWDDSFLDGYQAKFGTDAKTPTAMLNTYFASNAKRRQYLVIKAGAAGAKPFAVTGEPGEYGEVTPAYGSYDDVGKLESKEFSAPQFVMNGNTRYECDGYVLSTVVDGVATDPVTNGARTFIFDPQDENLHQIKWLWRDVGYRTTIVYPQGLGTVDVPQPGADDCYAKGSTVTLTARPSGDAVFDCWYGDVDEQQAKNATIEIVMDGEKTITPYFRKNWEIAADGKSISDGYWTLAVSGSASALTISKQTIRPEALTVLDLRKPVAGGGVITAIADNFAGGQGTYTYLEEVTLPDTLLSIGASAFRGQANLKTVYPLLPDAVNTLGFMAFASCGSLDGELTIGKVNDVGFGISSGTANTFNGCGSLKSIVLGEKQTTVAAGVFSGCSGVTNVVFSESLTSIGTSGFDKMGSVKTAVNFLPPTVNSIGAYAFRNWSACETDLKIGMDKKVSVSFNSTGNQFVGLEHVRRITLGEGVTSIPQYMFNACCNIQEITLLGAVTSIGAAAFRVNSGGVLQAPVFRLASYPDSWGAAPFQNWANYCTCVYLPKGDAGWAAFMADPEKMTPWAEVSPGEQQTFSNNFRTATQNPKGMTLSTDNTAAGPHFHKQWVFLWNPKPSGMRIIFR